jgi:hypothetical protein
MGRTYSAFVQTGYIFGEEKLYEGEQNLYEGKENLYEGLGL